MGLPDPNFAFWEKILKGYAEMMIDLFATTLPHALDMSLLFMWLEKTNYLKKFIILQVHFLSTREKTNIFLVQEPKLQ